MKRVLQFVSLVSLVLSFFLISSCEEATILTISDSSLSFGELGGTKGITLVANKIWNASSDKDWCTISPTLGDGSSDTNFTLYIQCAINYDYQDRNCTITFTSSGETISLIVNQSERTGIEGVETDYTVSYEAQYYTIHFESNVEFQAVGFSSSKDWISVVDTKGLSNSEITLSIAENDGYKRSGKIRIKYRGSINVLYTDGHWERHISDIYKDVNIHQEDSPLTTQYVNLDDNTLFKSYCIDNFDKNKDGKLSYYEALQVTAIGIEKEGINSLPGIEFFKNLKILYCSNNDLKNLDLTYNTELIELRCSNNPLSTLNVSTCTKLTSLYCNSCKLTNLDVSKNTALTTLMCSSNSFTNLDVSNHSLLSELGCTYGPLINLDVSGCTSLSRLTCFNNQLTNLNASGCTTPMQLDCRNNKLATLNINGTSLNTLNCNNNQLKTLDVSGRTDLSWIECENNLLTSINVAGCTALGQIHCENNQLTILDVSDCPKLFGLHCQNNPYLTEIWLKKGQNIGLVYDENVATLKYKD